MATLLDGVSANGAGSSTEFTSPTSVQAFGTFDGGFVDLEGSLDDTNFVFLHRFWGSEIVTVDAQGTYYLRGNVSRAGGSASITLETS